MLPVIAIVGRPNVGKSTLFNRLTRTRDALVADIPGVTRDRQYGDIDFQGRRAIVVDTGGLEHDAEGISQAMMSQTSQAIDESDVVLFMVDAQEGLTHWDRQIAQQLRQLDKPIIVLLNKVDGLDANVISAEFFELGLSDMLPMAAGSGRGIKKCLEALLPLLPEDFSEEKMRGINVAVIGRPNVGKSTLINRILGEERVVVYDEPGTTRDSIFIPFNRRGTDYTLIDTAGVRRRSKISEALEKDSVIKTMRALDAANVVVFIVDAQENITEQDLRLLGLVIKSGRSLLVAVNKWDGLPEDQRDYVDKELDRRLVFVDYAKIHHISALHGTGVGDLFHSINAAYASATKEISTSDVTRILETATESHPPPLVRGRRPKLRYAHVGGYNPPTIVIHGNQTEELPGSYERYLSNYFRQTMKLVGTPVRIYLKTGDNPFKGKKNKLTGRQIKRRRRLMKHVKSK